LATPVVERSSLRGRGGLCTNPFGIMRGKLLGYPADLSAEVLTKVELVNKVGSPRTNLLRKFNGVKIFSNTHRQLVNVEVDAPSAPLKSHLRGLGTDWNFVPDYR